MPGNHRAQSRAPGGERVWLWAIPIVVVVVVAAFLIPHLLGGGDNGQQPGKTATPAQNLSPSATPSGTPSTTQEPTATSSATAPTTPAPTPNPVAAAPPRRLVVGNLVDAGFANALQTRSGRLIPTTADQLQRLSSRGVPGSPGDDTVVVVGAASSTSTASTTAFDNLGSVRIGATVEVETYAGTLTYTVSSRTRHNPDTVLDMPSVRAHHRGRLVLVVAHYTNGDRTGDDLVVVAQLTKAVSERP